MGANSGLGAYSNKFGKHNIHLSCGCWFPHEGTRMISGVNVGASVDKYAEKGGRGKKGQGKHHDAVVPLMYFTFWIELTGGEISSKGVVNYFCI